MSRNSNYSIESSYHSESQAEEISNINYVEEANLAAEILANMSPQSYYPYNNIDFRNDNENEIYQKI